MSMREQFVRTTTEAMDADPRIALVLAEISSDRFTEPRHADRIFNVGIREQAMVGVAGGLALAGMRPVLHSITPFVVERPFEQLKLDLSHQGVGAIAVSTGASYDYPTAGRTHMAPGDVALIDTLPGWTVHVPGHPAEVDALLSREFAHDGPVYLRLSDRVNAEPLVGGPGWRRVRHGREGVVLAVGPMLAPVLAATAAMDVTVLYTATIRPFDTGGLRAAVRAARPDVVLVEPYLRGTSTHEVTAALADVPHRVLSLGVRRDRELRAYGTADEHEAAHGLGPSGLAGEIAHFLRGQDQSGGASPVA
ncbi:transketolase C-terminal domain-containing protein [Saccharopolyspora sp. TS4A08]|uniref:Transketolase C-terminal domain-containing protein n=1 Tax=Saccharopolyspora ipomoeae TaxID=3042027 RepID=A0ABT6PLC7_9PSEU|nr:transketolase C-terminal domain-containing protein [Saccharopolyspora sp. TS4A08]MDI2028301.1 transketolase C-terminal domain-containing protein [Saccharopolyspora sp. TS4A08]